jgi:S-adenosylmethionine decarboxylase proenzyme
MESEQIEKEGFPDGVLGVHYLWDLKGVDSEKLDDIEFVEKVMLEAAMVCGATVLDHRSHHFEPQGVTVMILLAESHLSFHSWPERGAAAADFFSCSSKMDHRKIESQLREAFEPHHISEASLVRGESLGVDFS